MKDHKFYLSDKITLKIRRKKLRVSKENRMYNPLDYIIQVNELELVIFPVSYSSLSNSY